MKLAYTILCFFLTLSLSASAEPYSLQEIKFADDGRFFNLASFGTHPFSIGDAQCGDNGELCSSIAYLDESSKLIERSISDYKIRQSARTRIEGVLADGSLIVQKTNSGSTSILRIFPDGALKRLVRVPNSGSINVYRVNNRGQVLFSTSKTTYPSSGGARMRTEVKFAENENIRTFATIRNSAPSKFGPLGSEFVAGINLYEDGSWLYSSVTGFGRKATQFTVRGINSTLWRLEKQNINGVSLTPPPIGVEDTSAATLWMHGRSLEYDSKVDGSRYTAADHCYSIFQSDDRFLVKPCTYGSEADKRVTVLTKSGPKVTNCKAFDESSILPVAALPNGAILVEATSLKEDRKRKTFLMTPGGNDCN